MDDFYTAILHISFYILIYGLFSRKLQGSLFLTEPMLGVVYGLLISENFINILKTDYRESKIAIFYISKIILCIQTMSTAMSLPHGFIFTNYLSILSLVVLIGIIKYLSTAILIFLFSKYNAIVSLAIAASLTPTDPVLSSTIIKSKFANDHVPEKLRNLLLAESGINDGFGLLLLFIPIDILNSTDFYSASLNIIAKTFIYKCVFPALIGIVVGYVARRLLYICYKCDSFGQETFLVYGIALTFFMLGLMESFRMSELVGIFFTGTAFTWDEWFVFETRNSQLQEVIDSLLTCTFFVLFGARIDLSFTTFNLIVLALIIICLRRILICYILYPWIPIIDNKKEGIFIGWFGPIGVGALYYSLYFDRLVGTSTYDSVGIVVMLSIFVHGITMILLKFSTTSMGKNIPLLNTIYRSFVFEN